MNLGSTMGKQSETSELEESSENDLISLLIRVSAMWSICGTLMLRKIKFLGGSREIVQKAEHLPCTRLSGLD